MNALSLLNNLDREFTRPFMNPVWLKDFEDMGTPQFNMSSRMKYNEDGTAWEVTLEAAGVTKENLKIDVKDGLLSVTGEKTKGLELGKFERHFKIPEGIDVEKVEAQFTDGVLMVHLPLEAKKAPKNIQIS
jgi:HSP20 family protein